MSHNMRADTKCKDPLIIICCLLCGLLTWSQLVLPSFSNWIKITQYDVQDGAGVPGLPSAAANSCCVCIIFNVNSLLLYSRQPLLDFQSSTNILVYRPEDGQSIASTLVKGPCSPCLRTCAAPLANVAGGGWSWRPVWCLPSALFIWFYYMLCLFLIWKFVMLFFLITCRLCLTSLCPIMQSEVVSLFSPPVCLTPSLLLCSLPALINTLSPRHWIDRWSQFLVSHHLLDCPGHCCAT